LDKNGRGAMRGGFGGSSTKIERVNRRRGCRIWVGVGSGSGRRIAMAMGGSASGGRRGRRIALRGRWRAVRSRMGCSCSTLATTGDASTGRRAARGLIGKTGWNAATVIGWRRGRARVARS